MQQANTIQARDLKESIFTAVAKFTGYSLAGVFASILLISLFIGLQEMPNRIEAAKQQYIDYQVKIKNPKYIDVNFINE